MKNLLIFTSRGGNEFSDFWGLNSESNIVFKGKEYTTSEGGWDFDKIEEKIKSNEYLVFLHENMQTKTKKKKTKNGIAYTIYFYTTLDESLTGNLWSWNGNKFECANPELPFDLLCCALRNKGDSNQIEKAKKKIFEWYESKTKTAENQKQKLKYLLCCMSKETMAVKSDIIKKTNIFPEEIRPKIDEQIGIMEEATDFKSTDYQNAFLELSRILDEIT